MVPTLKGQRQTITDKISTRFKIIESGLDRCFSDLLGYVQHGNARETKQLLQSQIYIHRGAQVKETSISSQNAWWPKNGMTENGKKDGCVGLPVPRDKGDQC